MLGCFRKMFIELLIFSGSLTGMVKYFSLTICMSLNNQSCMARPARFDLNPDEYNQGLRYYGSCSLFALITRINESKTLIKYIM